MIILTLMFIAYYCISLLKGDLYYNIIQKYGELAIQATGIKNEKEKEEIGSKILKNIWIMFLEIPLITVMYIYFLIAIFSNIDIYKLPSIIIFIYGLVTTFKISKNKKTKEDLTTEEDRLKAITKLKNIKRFTLKNTIMYLIYLSYFGYMLYLLVLKS